MDDPVTKANVLKAIKSKKLHDSVPEIVVAIINITRSKSASVNDLVQVIELDEVLSARILSIANSGFYGLDREVKKVADAVVFMGWNTIKMISLGATIMKAISLRNTRLYTHSVRTAQFARFLATEAGYYKVEEISVVGLLHDIGGIILQDNFTETYMQAKQYAIDNNVPMYIAERDLIGCDHAMVGAWTVESWQLPDNIVETIELHHEFDPNAFHAKKTAVIHIADSLAMMGDFYGPAWEKVTGIARSSLQTMGFTEEEFRKLALKCMKMKFEPIIM